MLTRIYRDKAALPPAHRQTLDEQERELRELLLQPSTVDRRYRRRLRAVLGHAVSFWTWRSLCVDQGLPNHEAVEAMTALASHFR